MDYGARAREYFMAGYNCAQAVFLACTEDCGLSWDEDTRARLASSFGGGIGGMRQVCGALSGMLMALGLRDGYSNPADKAAKAAQYETIQALSEEFHAQAGSIICRELLGLGEDCKPKPPEARTPEYYEKRPCPRLCEIAGNVFARYAAEHPQAKE